MAEIVNSQQSQFEELLASLSGGGGGIFGLGDVASSGLLTAGGTLLQGLSGLLGGKSDAEKQREKVFNLAQSRLGQSVLDPRQYLAEAEQALRPQQEAEAERINTRLGLASGVAQGELAERRQAPMSRFLIESLQLNDQLVAQNDSTLLALMGGLSQG